MHDDVCVKVSSNEKDAQNLLDSSDYTCWSPSLRAPHYIWISSKRLFNRVTLVNQMGYNCKTVEVAGKRYFFDEDTVSQIILVDEDVSKVMLKIVETWDPYGRICIYNVVLSERNGEVIQD